MIHSEIVRVFFTIALFGIDLTKGKLTQCSLDPINGELGKMPLAYTFDENSQPYIIYPNSEGYFTIDSDKMIHLSCVSSNFYLFDKLQDIEVTCLKRTQYYYNKQLYDLSRLRCKAYVQSETRLTTKKCRPYNNTVYDVGYQTRHAFFPLYSVCFDDKYLDTIYTWYRVRVPKTDKYQLYKRSNFFQPESLGGITVEPLYSKATQRKTINTILNLPENSTQYIDFKDHYLTKSHFVPRTDLYFAREQAATSSYMNISPVWRKCNATWSEIENVVREGMHQNPYHRFVIVTGVYGTYRLPDYKNKEQRLYLDLFLNRISVPKFLWKLVYDYDDESNSVVYITYNNRTEKPEENVVRELNCISITCPGNITKDYANSYIEEHIMYCCDITSFQDAYGKFNSYVFTVGPKIDPPPSTMGV